MPNAIPSGSCASGRSDLPWRAHLSYLRDLRRRNGTPVTAMSPSSSARRCALAQTAEPRLRGVVPTRADCLIAIAPESPRSPAVECHPVHDACGVRDTKTNGQGIEPRSSVSVPAGATTIALSHTLEAPRGKWRQTLSVGLRADDGATRGDARASLIPARAWLLAAIVAAAAASCTPRRLPCPCLR
jgi:hypothetical protein